MAPARVLAWTLLLLLCAPSAWGAKALAAEDAEPAPLGAAAPEEAARPPNIVLFLADDLGWADTTLTGSTFYETPNVERLAKSGARFTAAYTTPICNATRAGLLTGRYPGARLKIVGGRASRNPGVPERDDPAHRMVRPERVPALLPREVTIAEDLRRGGYTTWFAGKWDLGTANQGPDRQGFHRVLQVGKRAVKSHFAPYGDGLRDAPPGTYLADRLTDEVIDWMHWEQRDGRPFFLYLAHHSVHSPWEGKKELVVKYMRKAASAGDDAPQRNPIMGAMIESLDDSLGRILDTLDELGIADHTIVIFMSDNGAVTGRFRGSPLTSNAPLRGEKGSTLEGGVRVPMVVRWPGVTRAGSVVDAPVSHVDIYPTLLAAAGIAPPSDRVLDGEDLRPLLTGEAQRRSRPVFTHFPINEYTSTVRDGDWKLIRYYGEGRGGAPRDALYNLAQDIGELHDLAGAEPEKAAQLAALLDAWLEETGALLPIPNPAYREER